MNLCHKKEVEKVADSVDIEDLGEKAVFCRCWRSKKVRRLRQKWGWQIGEGLILSYK